MQFIDLYNNLIGQQDLREKEANFLLGEILDGTILPAQIAAVLTALTIKGETVAEISGFIRAMRQRMVPVETDGDALDTCGTGGDGTGTFNISTCVALVAAGAGVPVVKHGNRNASSKCGSADVLEALGVNINLTPIAAGRVFKKVGMVFLFAPAFHPALKFLAPIRKELGFRTVFNYLGPFCNPAKASRQLVGVPNDAVAKRLAEVAKKLQYERLFIAVEKSGLDEIGLSDKTKIYDISFDTMRTITVNPAKLGFKKTGISSLKGGDAKENAAITYDVLKGKPGAKRDIVVLNAAYALLAFGAVAKAEEGVKLAARAIDDGSALNVLNNLIKETQHYAK